jgi:hypothetical protein
MREEAKVWPSTKIILYRSIRRKRQVKILKKRGGERKYSHYTYVLVVLWQREEAAAFQCVAVCESISSGGEAKVPVA